jgi:hypothetical protein
MEAGMNEQIHVLRDGTRTDVAELLGTTLDRLYLSPDDETDLYRATRHVVWQTMAAMIAKDVPPPNAVQMLMAVMMELLANGLGPIGAADHLRRMARALESVPSN